MENLSEELRKLWNRQRDYNSVIRSAEHIPDNGQTEKDHWTEKYILGLISEIDELLNAVNWKRHRKVRKSAPDRTDLALSLADITKYVICLWELWGFSPEDMVSYSNSKSEFLEAQWRMENLSLPISRRIVISDIDGTLADWRKSFILWLEETKGMKINSEDKYSTMLMDHELSMLYPEYYSLKEEFEASGGYANLIPYRDSLALMEDLIEDGCFSIVYTARPAKQHQRIWGDTWSWLNKHGIVPDQLVIGHEPRILAADKLRKQNKVVMLEDDPGLMIRAANLGIQVYARRTRYNENIFHDNIHVLDNFEMLIGEEIFDER